MFNIREQTRLLNNVSKKLYSYFNHKNKIHIVMRSHQVYELRNDLI